VLLLHAPAAAVYLQTPQHDCTTIAGQERRASRILIIRKPIIRNILRGKKNKGLRQKRIIV